MQEIMKFFQDMFLDLFDNFQEVFLSIIVMVIVMILGFIISWFIKKLLGKLLVLFRFDRWAQDAGMITFLKRAASGVRLPLSEQDRFTGSSSSFSCPSGLTTWGSRSSRVCFQDLLGPSQHHSIAGPSHHRHHIQQFLGRIIYLTCENARISMPTSSPKG